MTETKVWLLLSSIVAMTLCSFAILAQVQTQPNVTTVEIHGQVRLAEGGKPAENVLVRLESYDGGGSISEAFTDRLGKFRFTSLPPAQYSVRVHQSGYRDAQQQVDMTTSTSGLVYLQLLRIVQRHRLRLLREVSTRTCRRARRKSLIRVSRR
jgi:adenine C2-methylase RlmN of 23S rRNA A2503 and tRNA A37